MQQTRENSLIDYDNKTRKKFKLKLKYCSLKQPQSFHPCSKYYKKLYGVLQLLLLLLCGKAFNMNYVETMVCTQQIHIFNMNKSCGFIFYFNILPQTETLFLLFFLQFYVASHHPFICFTSELRWSIKSWLKAVILVIIKE